MLKNIVIFNDNAHVTGGADKIALTSAQALAQRGYAVTLLTAVGPVDPELENTPNLRVLCTNQHEILNDPNRLRAVVQGLWNLPSQRAAQNLFGTLRPKETVVHLHLWAKALSSSTMHAATSGGFSVAATLHDYMLACPTGTLFDHPRQQICTRRPMSFDCISAHCDRRGYGDKLWRVTREAVQMHLGNLPSGLTDIIAISDLVLSVMKPYLPAKARIHTLSNFVDIAHQPAVEVERNADFVFLGRLVPEKGPVLFAEAARQTALPAVFLGDGPAREAVQQSNAGARISGWLSPAVAAEQLRHARALVFPSLWYEAQPLVILEAMAQGIPCLVADTSAAREMIIDGHTGLHFRGADREHLAQQMLRLAEPSFASQLGRNAYNSYWEQPRTLDRHLDGLVSIYEQMLVSRASPVAEYSTR